jgi:NTP pyrophosphatase (non-canonical NTP hydrolase)
MVNDQGWYLGDFIAPEKEVFWEVGEFIFFQSQNLQQIQPMSALYKTEWEYFYREGLRNYALRFERDSNATPTMAVYREVALEDLDVNLCLAERSLHSEMVQALCKSGELIRSELTAQDAHNLHMVVGISGEAGELLDCVKKAVIYRKPIDMENLIEELGDLEFYMEGLRQSFGITRNQTLSHNITKLSKRYEGLKFTNEAAQLRADKQHEPVTA